MHTRVLVAIVKPNFIFDLAFNSKICTNLNIGPVDPDQICIVYSRFMSARKFPNM